MIELPVQVFYNTNPMAMLHGYSDTDSLRPVFSDRLNLLWISTTGKLEVDYCNRLREHVIAIFNGIYADGDDEVMPYAAMVKRFESGDIRSMSVGDVLRVGEEAWAVKPVGWEDIVIPGITSSNMV